MVDWKDLKRQFPFSAHKVTHSSGWLRKIFDCGRDLVLCTLSSHDQALYFPQVKFSSRSNKKHPKLNPQFLFVFFTKDFTKICNYLGLKAFQNVFLV